LTESFAGALVDTAFALRDGKGERSHQLYSEDIDVTHLTIEIIELIHTPIPPRLWLNQSSNGIATLDNPLTVYLHPQDSAPSVRRR
jgi:hypothetical protein